MRKLAGLLALIALAVTGLFLGLLLASANGGNALRVTLAGFFDHSEFLCRDVRLVVPPFVEYTHLGAIVPHRGVNVVASMIKADDERNRTTSTEFGVGSEFKNIKLASLRPISVLYYAPNIYNSVISQVIGGEGLSYTHRLLASHLESLCPGILSTAFADDCERLVNRLSNFSVNPMRRIVGRSQAKVLEVDRYRIAPSVLRNVGLTFIVQKVSSYLGHGCPLGQIQLSLFLLAAHGVYNILDRLSQCN